MKNSQLYIRTLKRVDHSVFSVEKGQKIYYEPQFRKYLPYSSGQQVKRSIVNCINEQLETAGSPTTFFFTEKTGKEGEVHGTCNPRDVDQLIGGWMQTPNIKSAFKRTIKRRSPLSISAMRPLHPLLANTPQEDISFDRSSHPQNNIIVTNSTGKKVVWEGSNPSKEELTKLFDKEDKSVNRKWILKNSRATGLFVQDIAIDLRRLYTVSLNSMEPEISDETEQQLRSNGWEEIETVFGPSLIAPVDLREKTANALATALIDWRITSNQSRTFSLMETIALAVSPSARNIGTAIRAELSEYGEEEKDRLVNVVISEDMKNVDTFISSAAKGYVFSKNYKASALDDAEAHLRGILAPKQ